ncbi:MAG: urea carboxylase [Steroidobacteraceae bacterium]
MFKRVLIANRGAIACRIIRTLRRMGVSSVAVHSEADRQSLHVAQADDAVYVGPAAAAQSYLQPDRILDAARATGAEAIHPGYGFLSENADFAAACENAHIAFIGPRPEHIRAFGLKHRARELALAQNVPLLPGSGLLPDIEAARIAASKLGYPLMLKSTAGGGGIGMRLVQAVQQLPEAFASVEQLALSSFADAGLYLEKYVVHARHIEVQIFGDGRGKVISLGERDCSVQRRNQKVIDESPAPGLDDRLRNRLQDTAVRLAAAVRYRSAGTVEFLFDAVTGQYYFLEVNTRLQVEHGVTEQVTGIDLVEWMVRLAAGELRPLERIRPHMQGHSIQARIYAEDPARNFQPSAGVLTDVRFPSAVRVETWVERGIEVSPHYDPLLAKVIATGETRAIALSRLEQALDGTRITGIETNIDYLRSVLADPSFVAGLHSTRLLEGFRYRPPVVHVVESGVQTSVQDWPGRLGYWDVGVPPSGPMDSFAFRVANELVGNQRGSRNTTTAGLECTMTGPTLRFDCDAVVAVTGAPMDLTLDGEALEMWTSHAISAGTILKMGRMRGPGSRAYLAVAGGLDVPAYLGSRATFMLGRFGGHGGRTLRAGDVLHLVSTTISATLLSAAQVPAYPQRWEIGVLLGPHAAPDYFAPEDIAALFTADWSVHYNSSRTGVRLVGPKPQWARTDGGEAGLHPSNIHDNAYAIGAIDFTGDMPVILGPDGPSLGGFVCPGVLAHAELWKLGQLRPGDVVNFRQISIHQAADLERALERSIEDLDLPPPLPAAIATGNTSAIRSESAIIGTLQARPGRAAVTYRQSGDHYLLIEYGELVLDLSLRLRAHALAGALRSSGVTGLVDITPGIRSLQVHFDPARLPRANLMRALLKGEEELVPVDEMVVPGRIVHLPLSWDDPATRLAIEKYMQSVRADAPWCPSNIEFIRRMNGLASIEDVRRIVFDASYLVLGLGDVYLGAPVATPLDPRHRLVTTKYNPARTWTPENAVGIGGAYLCVYGMEGPGGYQFVGRTLQMWNRYRVTREFEWGKPWLLRCFDQIRFYPVTDTELTSLREEFAAGRYHLKIEPTTFSLREYRQFLTREAPSINAFKLRQQAAFETERERWRLTGLTQDPGESLRIDPSGTQRRIPENARTVAATVPGSVWKILAHPGDRVAMGDTLLIVESMKMEFNLVSPCAGKVITLLCRDGMAVSAGQDVLVIEPD